jgi:hypothetical protein
MCEGWEMLSGKFAVAATLLKRLQAETSDRIVIVSNYTQTLDLFQLLCSTRKVQLILSISFWECSTVIRNKNVQSIQYSVFE